ncbi:hypothetical protein QE152_g34980 [Popillia japonica]|uniref:Reverse transcriptase n=1 Tax=Popillia japonica TaxID=7064 RepID=A0AAW1IT13_POPJA
MFADDVCIYTRSISARIVERRLQGSLDRLNNWDKTWRIRVHAEKSAAVPFSRTGKRKRKHGEPGRLTILGDEIPWCSRILEIFLDSRLTFGPHVQFVTNRARRMLGALFAMLNRKSNLDPTCKIRIYTAVIRPTMLYASAVWATAAECHLKRLQVFQNRVLRMAINAPWYAWNTTIRRDTNMETIKEFNEPPPRPLRESKTTLIR